MKSDINADEKEYWNTILNAIPQSHFVEKETAYESIRLSEKYTNDLLQQANKAYHTEVNDLLLTALGLTLQSWNDASIQIITMEAHGREPLKETIDHSKTIGWFTTMYPVQLHLQENIESSIKSIKEIFPSFC